MSAEFFPNCRQAAVSLSFDDARLSQADVGLPLLDELGIRELCRYCIDRQEEVWIDTVATVATHINNVREQQSKPGEHSCTG